MRRFKYVGFIADLAQASGAETSKLKKQSN